MNLKDVIYRSDLNEMIKYIHSNFVGSGLNKKQKKRKYFIFKNKEVKQLTTEEIQRNIEIINDLDINTLKYGIARMMRIEEASDFPKVASVTVALILPVIASYNDFFSKMVSPIISENGLKMLTLVGVFYYMGLLIFDSRTNRSTVVFFRKLLEDALQEKREK